MNPLLTGLASFETAHVRLATDDGEIAAYVAHPVGDPPWPGVLFVHENRGLVPYMIDVVDALAEAGCFVFAPDLLSRLGGTARFAAEPDAVTTRDVPMERHVSDLAAADEHVRSSPLTDGVSLFGFCFGGELAWRLLTTHSYDRAVVFYGLDPGEDATQIHTPTLAIYAEDDPRINPGVEHLCTRLDRAGCTFIAESFPGTTHAFHHHLRPERYHPGAAAVAWHHALRFLATGAIEDN